MKFIPDPRFKKALKSLSKQNRAAAQRALEKLKTGNAPHSVKLRPLKGKLGLWIVNVTTKYRVIAKKEPENVLTLLDIGSHDTIYKRWTK